MILKQFYKITLIPILLIGFITSCDKNQDDNKLNIEFDKIVVNNEGEFTFKDSLIFLVCDTLQYEINIQTKPREVELFYSKNANDFTKLSGDWILIDSTFKTIRFYSQGQGFNTTDIHKIDFGFDNDSIISVVNLYPNPFVNSIYFRFDSRNIRGGYDYKIYDLTGKTILSDNDFISDDEIEKNIDLSDLSSGIYLMQFDFGNTKLINKMIKQ